MEIMTILSVIILILLSYLLIRKSENHLIVIVALKVKILAGIGLGVLYVFHYQGGDTLQFFAEAATIANYLIDHPADMFSIYFQTEQATELWNQLVYTNEPRALFFSKITSFFYLITGGNYWTMGAYFSLISFVGIYFLVEELDKSFNQLKLPSFLAFYFLPTFVFWTSGLLKESLTLFALCVVITIILIFIRTKEYFNIKLWISLFTAIWLLWQLKYYYAAIAIPVLASLLVYHLTENAKKLRVVIVFLTLVLGFIIVTRLHYNLNIDHAFSVLYENYKEGTSRNAQPGITYYNFDGSFRGFLMNFPIALFSGLFRPMVSETNNALQLIVSLENLLILIVLIIGVIKSKFRISFRNPYLLITIGYVIILATLMAYSTPNFGTLSRYKVAYWPFFVLLVFALFFGNKKRPESL